MAQVQKTVLIHHSASRMYALVDDVTLYPEFLPWCGGVDLIQQDVGTTIATLHIAYRGIHQKFTTENHKTFPNLMKIILVDGPFKHLDGTWRFIELNEDACKIEFMLNYEFTNSILDRLIAPVFSHITSTFVDNFVARADVVYSTNKDSK
ncbi:MAG: type II toxin-antitoxin system RatA family toxin [Methylotenera sp.]|nr:type II toxin-antitoxin system RatA family toxin [Methylotenera sp.]